MVDELTSNLRLMVWYKDPKNKAGRIIYRRKTMDFGDAASVLIVRITQKKFVSPRAELEAPKHTVLSGGYDDNYSYSFRTLEEFRRVSADMENIHSDIGLPLKATLEQMLKY